jgi:putative lumazine-binding protein
MTTTETEIERGAITSVVEAYIDGARTGDADKLMEAFDQRAWMFGSLGGQRVDIPIAEMIEMVKAQPMGQTYEARITSVEQVGDAARVTLDETRCWGSVSFTDFFGLSKIEGEWKIVSKVFAHTGGEMPTG